MTKGKKKIIAKRIIKQAKVAPKRAAKAFETLGNTKVKWL